MLGWRKELEMQKKNQQTQKDNPNQNPKNSQNLRGDFLSYPRFYNDLFITDKCFHCTILLLLMVKTYI